MKAEPELMTIGVRGIRNVLIELGMIEGEPYEPPYQSLVTKTTWVRASVGGLLRFHIRPGDRVEADAPVATNFSILGSEQHILRSPSDGIVLGMATSPAVKPGEPVCHIAIPGRKLPVRRKSSRSPRTRDRSVIATEAAAVEPAEGERSKDEFGDIP
jgi:predicted deacylase